MTPEERVFLIMHFCEHEMRDVDPTNMEIIKAAITAQIKAAVEDALAPYKQAPDDTRQLTLMRIKPRKR